MLRRSTASLVVGSSEEVNFVATKDVSIFIAAVFTERFPGFRVRSVGRCRGSFWRAVGGHFLGQGLVDRALNAGRNLSVQSDEESLQVDVLGKVDVFELVD